MKFTIKIDGVNQMMDNINVTVGIIDAPFVDARMLENLKQLFWNYMRLRFVKQGRHQGEERWAPLSPKYKKWKKEHYPGKTILRLTDRMFHSLTSASSDFRTEIGSKGKWLRLGTIVPYVRVHHRGSKEKHIPRRKIFVYTQRFKALCVRAIYMRSKSMMAQAWRHRTHGRY